MTFKWENRDRKLSKKRDLKEMNSAHRVFDAEEEAKKGYTPAHHTASI